MRKVTLLAAASTLALTASAAVAAPITGEISINGNDVFNNTQMAFIGSGNVGGTAGSFTELANCSGCVSFGINPMTASSGGTLWTVNEGGLSSTLSISPPNTFIVDGTAELPNLTIEGQGVLTLSGFDATNGTFEITTQGPEGTANVTFSATAVPVGGQPIPEPASLIVLGSALLGLGALRRRWGHS